jgi:hypothetical protein
VGKSINLSFAEITLRLLNKDYSLGKNDCFMVVYGYLKFRDPDLPVSHKGLTIDNYAQAYEEDPEKTKSIMFEAVSQYLEEIKPNFSVAGDILWMQYKFEPAFFAIDAGNGKAMASAPNVGVVQVPKEKYHILRAFRCQQ